MKNPLYIDENGIVRTNQSLEKDEVIKVPLEIMLYLNRQKIEG